MGILQEGDFGINIPERIVINTEQWKVLGIFPTKCTVYGDPDELFRVGLDDRSELDRLINRPTWQEEREVALIMPQKPGRGFWQGFDMKLVQLNEQGEMASKGTTCVGVHYMGIAGFILDTAISIDLDKYDWHGLQKTWGISYRTSQLKAVINKHRAVLTRKPRNLSDSSLQTKWEVIAKELTPYVAAFFDFRPEWEIGLDNLKAPNENLKNN